MQIDTFRGIISPDRTFGLLDSITGQTQRIFPVCGGTDSDFRYIFGIFLYLWRSIFKEAAQKNRCALLLPRANFIGNRQCSFSVADSK